MQNVYQSRDELEETFRCEADLESVEWVFDRIVIHAEGDKATASYRFQVTSRYPIRNNPSQCIERSGLVTSELERQPSEEWLITTETFDYQPQIEGPCW